MRYLRTAHEFDEALVEELAEHQTLKAAEKAEKPADNAILRIAREKSPLDEVKALIESTKTKSAEEELREYRVQQKLAAMKDPGKIDAFLEASKAASHFSESEVDQMISGLTEMRNKKKAIAERGGIRGWLAKRTVAALDRDLQSFHDHRDKLIKRS